MGDGNQNLDDLWMNKAASIADMANMLKRDDLNFLSNKSEQTRFTQKDQMYKSTVQELRQYISDLAKDDWMYENSDIPSSLKPRSSRPESTPWDK